MTALEEVMKSTKMQKITLRCGCIQQYEDEEADDDWHEDTYDWKEKMREKKRKAQKVQLHPERAFDRDLNFPVTARRLQQFKGR